MAAQALAQGGPPLVTDDPGTPGNGNWEVNIAGQWTRSSSSTITEIPLFDVNYGWGEHLQLNLNTGWITVREMGEDKQSGLSVASLAVKWRFVDEERAGVSISTYPRADFHHNLSSHNTVINPPGTRYFLPIEISKEFGPFGINPEIGYATQTELGGSEWDYGIVCSYAFKKEKEILAEVHGRSAVDRLDQEWLFNLGARYLLTESSSLMGSIGRIFAAYDGELPRLNMYLGVQVRL